MTDDKKDMKDITWVSPPCEHYSKGPRTPTADRIRAGVEKYLREHPSVEVDGERFQIVDVGVTRGLTTNELMRLQGFQSPLVAIDHDAAAIRKHMTDHTKRQPVPTLPAFIDLHPDLPATDATLESVRAKLQEKNLRVYLETEALAFGTADQRERYHAGYLPEDELTALARRVLFEPFAALDLRRWASRDRDALARAVRHRATCTGTPTIELETCEVAELDADQWKRLKMIQAAAEAVSKHAWLDPERCGGAVLVTTAAHWATCPTCEAEVVRPSAKVTIHWAGRALVREWSL